MTSCHGSHNRQDSRNCSRTRDSDDWCAWSIAAKIPSTSWIKPGRKISDSWSSQKRSSPSLDGLLVRLGQSRYWKPLAWASNHERLIVMHRFNKLDKELATITNYIKFSQTSKLQLFTLVFCIFLFYLITIVSTLVKHDALTLNEAITLAFEIQASYHLNMTNEKRVSQCQKVGNSSDVVVCFCEGNGLRFRIVTTLKMGSPSISDCWAWHA